MTPTYQWDQNPAGTALSYVNAPLASNTVVIGGGSVQAWIKASVPSVDLQVTISEVRPDGMETFVQDGWLRTSERKLAPGSTPLYPKPTYARADAAPLPTGVWTEVTIPLYFEGHAYRAGSRIRVTISAPGDAQPIWAFADTVPTGTANVQLAYSPTMRSMLTLPSCPASPCRRRCRRARACAASRAGPTFRSSTRASRPSLPIGRGRARRRHRPLFDQTSGLSTWPGFWTKV